MAILLELQGVSIAYSACNFDWNSFCNIAWPSYRSNCGDQHQRLQAVPTILSQQKRSRARYARYAKSSFCRSKQGNSEPDVSTNLRIITLKAHMNCYLNSLDQLVFFSFFIMIMTCLNIDFQKPKNK